MNHKLIALLFSFCLVTAALRAADFKVDPVVARATAEPKNAPAIIVRAAADHPAHLAEIVTATVMALPDQAVEIMQALLLAAPKNWETIITAAIRAQPARAAEFTAAAVNALPDQAPTIIKAATAAAPEDLQSEVAGTPLPPPKPLATPTPFPVQPIRPDVVSPSH